VALPENVLRTFLHDARANMRSASAPVVMIIRERYAKQQEVWS
jgi:hypothetical protein